MHEQDIVMCLRANSEIMSLKNGNLSLKEQVEQLQHQLKDKDGLIKKETKKRRARCRAYIHCLAELTECPAKARSMEASLHQEPPQPETSWSREVEVEKENQALKGQVNLLEVGEKRLMEELINKNQLIICETKKRRTPYISCPALHTTEEKELRKSRGLEVKLQLQQETTPTEGMSCRKVVAEMSWSREEEVEKENKAVKEQVNPLKVRQRRLEDELINENQLIMSKTKKRKIRSNAYFGCLAELTAEEKLMKKSRAETLEVKLQQETTPTERLSCRNVEAVNKENTSQNEQVHRMKSEQRKS